jgi:hypothetical protein
MIRIHLVWSIFPLSPDTPPAIAQAANLHEEEVKGMMERHDDFVEVTKETTETTREERERLRASANYVLYLLHPMQLSPQAMIDLTLDLVNRPKRTVIVLCRFSPNDFLDPMVEGMITHLLRTFGEGEVQYCDRFHKLLGFLEERQPQKSPEAT